MTKGQRRAWVRLGRLAAIMVALAGAPAWTEEIAKAPGQLEPVRPDEVVAVLGTKVRGPNGKDIMGEVVDVLVGGDARPKAAIIDFGGFLGVGSRKIAVDWQLLTFRPWDREAPLLLSLERVQIQAAPEYQPKRTTKPAEVVVPPVAPPQPPPAAPPAPPDVAR